MVRVLSVNRCDHTSHTRCNGVAVVSAVGCSLQGTHTQQRLSERSCGGRLDGGSAAGWQSSERSYVETATGSSVGRQDVVGELQRPDDIVGGAAVEVGRSSCVVSSVFSV